jgi:hypothetical protein
MPRFWATRTEASQLIAERLWPRALFTSPHSPSKTGVNALLGERSTREARRVRGYGLSRERGPLTRRTACADLSPKGLGRAQKFP